MTRTKYLKAACQHCAGHIEYPAELIGTLVSCPHCQQETELLLLTPPAQPTIPRRALVWTVMGIVVLILGFGGALMALKRAQKWAENQKHRAAPTVVPSELETNLPTGVAETNSSSNRESQDGFARSEVALEKTPGSSLVYAVGTLKNTSDRRRFGVKVELNLRDATGRNIGTASDYVQVLEPGADWRFKAIVLESKTASATIASIKEER